MSTHWECTNCGGVIVLRRAPLRCRRCGSSDNTFSRHDNRDEELSPPELAYELWIRHGMRTTKHWRAHP